MALASRLPRSAAPRLARAWGWLGVMLACVVGAAPAAAQGQFEQHTEAPAPKPLRWSVGLTAGTYGPSLRSLNYALNTPGLVIQQDPNFLIPRNQDLPVEIRDIAAPDLTSTINYGIEAQWQWSQRISVVIMTLNWQGRSTASDTITMSLRSNLPPVQVPRTARYNLNVNQLWLGWRYAFFDRPGQGRMFVNIGVGGVSVADMNMDSLVKVILPDEQLIPSFASISSTEMHGTAYSSRYGVGGEVFVSQHVSVGFHVNYIFGEMQKFRVQRYFPAGFSELPPIPPDSTNNLPPNVIPTYFAQPDVGDQLSTAQIVTERETAELARNVRTLDLDLDGWEAAFTFRVYY